MQRIWYGVIIFAVMMPILYFIGFAMNDLLKDIRSKKEQHRKRSQNERQETRYSKQSSVRQDRPYLKAVK